MPQPEGKENSVMHWISFLVSTGLFIYSAITAIANRQETDKVLALVFLATSASIGGAAIMKLIEKKIK